MINIPKNVSEIIESLEAAGYEAYAVGGCVRDSLMGRDVSDWDITTDARPEEIKAVFNRRTVLPTGVKHGTVSLMLKGVAYEITTYRVDGLYSDGRRPDKVSFTKELREDLSRRDFTINAMAYNPRTGLVDPFGGVLDIRRRIVRCVGSPEERFGEDYLRMMRAYRFAAVLDFDLEKSIRTAVLANRDNIQNIAAERIRIEFDKLALCDAHDRFLMFMEDLGQVIFPEVHRLKDVRQVNAYHNLSVYNHTMEVFRHAERDLTQKLCALFHDIGKADTIIYGENGVTKFTGHAEVSGDMAFDILKRLKYDNARIKDVITIIRAHNVYKQLTIYGMKRRLLRTGSDLTRQLYRFAVADCSGKSPTAKNTLLPMLLANIDLIEKVENSGDPIFLRDLALNGKDVEGEGFKGRAVGEALSFLLDKVHKNPRLNRREILIGLLKDFTYCSND